MTCRFIGFYTPEVAHYALPNVDLIRAYCRKWGHELTIEDDTSKIFPSLQGRAIYWAYFPLLEQHWLEPGIDWFVKLDLDCVIKDPDYDITKWMTDDVDLVYASDIGPDRINAGVQLIRNCDECAGFYRRVWRAGASVARGQFLTGIFHEQTILSAAIDFHASLRPRIEIYPNDSPHSFNDFSVHPTTFIHHDLKKGADPMGCRCRLHDVPAPAPARTSIPISPDAPLKTVYYCYLVNNWRQLLQEQLTQLVQSGLAAACVEIWLCTAGTDDDNAEAQALARGIVGPSLRTWQQTGNAYELPGIRKVHELGQEGLCKILYFHSKGVSNQFTDFSSGKLSERKLKGAADWRRFMQHFLLDRWEDCVELLNSNDVVAAFINPDNAWPHGNFWWTTSHHVRTCAPPGGGDRWSYEAWVTTKGRPGKYHSFTTNDFDFHVSDHPAWLYSGEVPYIIRTLKIVSASYGAPEEQIDEGRPDPNKFHERGKCLDCTAAVQQLVNDNRLDFRVDNGLFGDPCFGIKKRLKIVWTTNECPDQQYLLYQDEGSPVKLEMPR